MNTGGLIEKVKFQQRLEGSERGSHEEIWRKSIPGRENSKCKGPEGGAHAACLRSNKEASMPSRE